MRISQLMMNMLRSLAVGGACVLLGGLTQTAQAQSTQPTGRDFSADDTVAILRALNNERATPKGPTPATPLPRLTWARDLASVSKYWASQCKIKRDPTLKLFGFTPSDFIQLVVGFNTAFKAGTTPTQAVAAWARSKSTYTFGPFAPIMNERQVYQYTQLIWASTKKVGCAYAVCPGAYRTVVVCSFREAGNRYGQRPYTPSAQ